MRAPLHAVQDAVPASIGEARGVQSARAARVGSEVLAVGRARAAAAFDSVLRGRVETGDYSASNCAIAERVGVVEKQIREYRNGDKALPLGAVYALPESVGLELLDVVRAEVLARREQPRTAQSHLGRIMMYTGSTAAELEAALADGTIDDTEARALAPLLSKLIEEAQRMLATVTRPSR